MIKSLPNLYSFLRLTESSVRSILENLDYFYTSRLQPKMKYGETQKDDLKKIRYRELIADILGTISLPRYMYGCVTGKNNILNAQRHFGHKYFLTIDLRNFFSNISHHQVYNMFERNGFSSSCSRILTKLTTYNSCLPQGVASSPIIGNLTCLPTSNKLMYLSADNKITFTSFLDDFTFSSNQCFRNFIPQLIAIIRKGGFFPAYNKIHYRKGYCEITGLFVNERTIALPYQMVKRAKTHIYLRPYQSVVQEHNNSLLFRNQS
jgi:RNA-directed DNA polymerase